jgi:hypothetical protein
MERLTLCDEIDIKAGIRPAEPVFEFADTLQVAHSFGWTSVLKIARPCK